MVNVITTRIWAEKGTRPRGVQQQQFEYAYLFGAVCINTSQTEALVMPYSNSDMMKVHLRLISDAAPKAKNAVVIPITLIKLSILLVKIT